MVELKHGNTASIRGKEIRGKDKEGKDLSYWPCFVALHSWEEGFSKKTAARRE